MAQIQAMDSEGSEGYGMTRSRSAPRDNVTASRPTSRVVREHIDVLSGSIDHTHKIVDELESRLESILKPESSDFGAKGDGELPEMSPLSTYLDGLVDRQDRLNGRLGMIIERLDL